MSKSKKLIDFIEQGTKYTGTNIGPMEPMKIEDQRQRLPRLDANTKRKANAYLSDVCKKYYPKIPVQEIFGTLRRNFGIVPLQEDGTAWEGFLTGEEGRMTLDIGPRSQFPEWPGSGEPGISTYPVYTNSNLVFSWYRMPETGNYEINAYLS